MRRFALRLAAHLGIYDVDGMLRNMSSRQLSEWMAFYALEPWGFRAFLFGFCIVAATLINLKLPKGKKRVEPLELLEIYAPDETKQKNTRRLSGDKFFDALKKYAIKKDKTHASGRTASRPKAG